MRRSDPVDNKIFLMLSQAIGVLCCSWHPKQSSLLNWMYFDPELQQICKSENNYSWFYYELVSFKVCTQYIWSWWCETWKRIWWFILWTCKLTMKENDKEIGINEKRKRWSIYVYIYIYIYYINIHIDR